MSGAAGVQVFYGRGADEVIERLVAKYIQERPMRVVSADGMVRETILSLGAEWFSPEILRSLCDGAETSMRARLA